MSLSARLLTFYKTYTILVGVLGFALVVRLAGICYGLPLMLVGDEPPFILGALKMLELHTVIPALHVPDFASILYYPPYLSYLLLAPFALILGIKYLLWHGASVLFLPNVVSDLSAFFITARVFDVVLGVASIYLVYRTAEHMFRSRTAALASAFLLATSITHIALSMTGRHWTVVTFLTISTLYILTRTSITPLKRYGYALLIAGLGMGFSTICVLLLIPIGFHFLYMSPSTLREALRSSFLWSCAVGALALAILPSLLYPRSNGFIADMTIRESKSLIDFLLSPLQLLALPFPSEPILIGLALVGLALLLKRERAFFQLAVTWIVLYAWVFYLLFRFETRFLVPLFPLFALLGGYAAMRIIEKKRGAILLGILLLVPLVCALRFSWLAALGDTRSHAREWVLTHILPGEKIVVYASLTRIPTTANAIEELHAIEPSALRKVDEAETALNDPRLPYALNLTNVSSTTFFAALPAYAKDHGYVSVLLDTTLLSTDEERASAFSKLTKNATVVAMWKGTDPGLSLGNSSLRDPFWRLFSGAGLGPEMVIYKLK